MHPGPGEKRSRYGHGPSGDEAVVMRLRCSICPGFSLAFQLVGAAAACAAPTAVYCFSVLRPALQVSVVDSLTGSESTDPATLTVRNDTVLQFTSDSTGVAGLPLELAVMQLAPGSYDLTVQAAGYHDWSRNGVRLWADECGVIHLTARLVSDWL